MKTLILIIMLTSIGLSSCAEVKTLNPTQQNFWPAPTCIIPNPARGMEYDNGQNVVVVCATGDFVRYTNQDIDTN